ncbi:MAG: aspartate aminotransferase family protein [Methanomassiliicoccales archaeon]
MNIKEVKEYSALHLFPNYAREEVCFERGSGEYLYDIDGNEYIDLVAGIAVNLLGHCHPSIVKVAKEQADRLIHVSNLYYIQEQLDLAMSLAEILPKPLSCSLFVNSGAEANEAALKLAAKNTGRKRFVSAYNSFHGRTMGALSATGQQKYHQGYEPLLSHAFDFIRYGNIEDLKEKINNETAAVILEPIQGEGGVIVPSKEFLKAARDLCDETGALLILDEVQTGFGRTGKMFAFEHFDIVPDIVTFAKGLGGGFPIGAITTSQDLAKTFQPGSHGSTFGGNPFVCRVAAKVIEIIKEEQLWKRAESVGDSWIVALSSIANDFNVDVRGKGLMIGIDFGETAKEFLRYCFERRILVNLCAGKVIRLVPPLILSDNSVRKFNEAFSSFILTYSKQSIK